MYKLTHVEKIRSPVVLIKPNNETLQFKDGLELSEATFQDRYVVNTIKAVDNKIEITLTLAPLMPKTMPQSMPQCNNNNSSNNSNNKNSNSVGIEGNDGNDGNDGRAESFF